MRAVVHELHAEWREDGRVEAANLASRRHPRVTVTRLFPQDPRAQAVEDFEHDADYGVGPQGARRPGGVR